MAKSETSSDSRLSGAIVAGVITFLLGGLLALASLISQPVEIRSRAPDPESLKPGEVHIVRGEHVGRTAWRSKEQAWMSAQVDRMILTETELNQWSGERLVAPKSSDEEAPSGWTDRFRMTVAPVNFLIMDEGIQLFTELRFPGLFADAVFPYRVFGHLETVPGGVRFTPVSGTPCVSIRGARPDER
jgi:hypothetical protein